MSKDYRKFIEKLYGLFDIVLNGGEINKEEALWLIAISPPDCFDLYSSANRLKEFYKGKKIKLCGIINAKSGKCSEDCIFCAQSAHYNTNIAEYSIKSKDEIIWYIPRKFRWR